ncbi:hypothetical protein LguiA_012986 [Lonicera macranthoides]
MAAKPTSSFSEALKHQNDSYKKEIAAPFSKTFAEGQGMRYPQSPSTLVCFEVNIQRREIVKIVHFSHWERKTRFKCAIDCTVNPIVCTVNPSILPFRRLDYSFWRPDYPFRRADCPYAMEEFHGPIIEIINQGLAGTLLLNPNYHFVNGRAYPRPHVDDWNEEPENHICIYALPPQREGGGVRGRGLIRPLADAWDRCPDDDEVLTPVEVRQRARTFLMYMLGQSVVANLAGSVHLWWLHLLRDFL